VACYVCHRVDVMFHVRAWSFKLTSDLGALWSTVDREAKSAEGYRIPLEVSRVQAMKCAQF